MARFQNKNTGVVVSVDDSKADRFGSEWKPLAAGETAGAGTKRSKGRPSTSVKPPTAVEILEAVGSDKALAAEALATEQATSKPRKSVVDGLTAVIDAEPAAD